MPDGRASCWIAGGSSTRRKSGTTCREERMHKVLNDRDLILLYLSCWTTAGVSA